MWHVCIQYTHTHTHTHTHTPTLSSVQSQRVKCLPAMQETWVQSLGWEDPLEKEMATHFGTLGWKIPWAEKPGRLQSVGFQRIKHDWATSFFTLGQLLSCVRLFETPWTAAHQVSLSITNPELARLMSIKYPSISSSVFPFSSCLQSFPASGIFPVSQFFASADLSIGASASALVIPMNIQDSFPLRLTGLISLQSKGPSRVFSNTTVQKHQFFSAQPSLWSNSYIHTWLLEKP